MFQLRQLDHVAITVSDLPRSIEWYRAVLGLERKPQETWGDYPAFVCAGDTGIALFPADLPNPVAAPDDRTALIMRHLAFRTDRKNFEQAQGALRRRGIDFRYQDHEVSYSIYFQDPDGHQIEITTCDLPENQSPD